MLSNNWFDDSIGNVGDKDERIKLHRSWIKKWGELEATFKRKDIATIKSFTATQIDRLRPPYGREVVDMPRWSVIVGSTNQDEFLADSTGNRRFWVIPVKRRIDLELLERARDQIWTAAVALHFQDEPHWLDAEGDQAASEAVKQYEISDPWESSILSYLDSTGRGEISVEELLVNLLQLETKDLDRQKQMRVPDILKWAGWVRSEGRKALNGKRVRVWTAPELPPILGEAELQPHESDEIPEPYQEIPAEIIAVSQSVFEPAITPLKPGDRVFYIGSKYPQYNSGQIRTLEQTNAGHGNFLTAEGGFSTWIPLCDLKRVEV